MIIHYIFVFINKLMRICYGYYLLITYRIFTIYEIIIHLNNKTKIYDEFSMLKNDISTSSPSSIINPCHLLLYKLN